MKILVTVVVAALAALGAGWMTEPAAARGASAPAAAERGELGVLRTEIAALEQTNRELVAELERRESTPLTAAALARGATEADIREALARWRAAHPEEARAAAEAPARRTPASSEELEIATIPIGDLVALLSNASLGHTERQELFQKLREAGRMDEYVAAVEKLAEADPKNADLQVALGNAYLQKLFEVGHTPEAGVWAVKSDQAFDTALEIDDHNWAARFTKAVSYSNWPAFLGKGPEAIDHLETLLEQQAEVPPRPEFAATYLFLGNLYQANGKTDKALETWKAGLALFPKVEDLQAAIDGVQPAAAPSRR